MWLFDSSMSALPILRSHTAARVSLFTCQQGTWAGFRPSRDRLVLSYCCTFTQFSHIHTVFNFVCVSFFLSLSLSESSLSLSEVSKLLTWERFLSVVRFAVKKPFFALCEVVWSIVCSLSGDRSYFSLSLHEWQTCSHIFHTHILPLCVQHVWLLLFCFSHVWIARHTNYLSQSLRRLKVDSSYTLALAFCSHSFLCVSSHTQICVWAFAFALLFVWFARHTRAISCSLFGGCKLIALTHCFMSTYCVLSRFLSERAFEFTVSALAIAYTYLFFVWSMARVFTHAQGLFFASVWSLRSQFARSRDFVCICFWAWLSPSHKHFFLCVHSVMRVSFFMPSRTHSVACVLRSNTAAHAQWRDISHTLFVSVH